MQRILKPNKIRKLIYSIFVLLGVLLLIIFLNAKVPMVKQQKEVVMKDTISIRHKPVEKETRWEVKWFALNGNLQRAGFLGVSEFPSTFIYDWGYGKVYKDYWDYIEFEANAEIYAPRSGLFFFEIGSDDGARLFLDGKLILSNQWKYGGTYKTTFRRIVLQKGLHELTLQYWERTRRAKVMFDCSPELLSWVENHPETTKVVIPETTTVIETLWIPRIKKILGHNNL